MPILAKTIVEFLGIPENFSEHGGSVDHLIDLVHWFMLALFVGWTTFFLFACWRFWRKRNPKASYHGVQNHVTTHLEVGVAIFEAVLLLGFAFPLWAERTDRFEDIQVQDPARVRVIGYQFGWNYHYPGLDGKFGRIDRHLVERAGDPCIDPEDPTNRIVLIVDFAQPFVRKHETYKNLLVSKVPTDLSLDEFRQLQSVQSRWRQRTQQNEKEL